MAPPATAVVPIGEALLIEGLKRRFSRAEFYVSATRPPAVYRGNPFVVEVGLAFGGDLPLDEPADIMRFANRVPLQYQPKACAISEAVYQTNWRGYELAQPKGSLPVAPLVIAVHLASVWVPFTSEAKEAVAHYDDLLREMKLAIQECGRKLARTLARAGACPARRDAAQPVREVHPRGGHVFVRDPRHSEGQGRGVRFTRPSRASCASPRRRPRRPRPTAMGAGEHLRRPERPLRRHPPPSRRRPGRRTARRRNLPRPPRRLAVRRRSAVSSSPFRSERWQQRRRPGATSRTETR